MEVDQKLKELETALAGGNTRKLRRLVSELKGQEIPLTPLVREHWNHYWEGIDFVDQGIRMVRTLFPQCGDSQFHPDLTLEEGLKAGNTRLVCERIWEQTLTEAQMEGVLDLWRAFLKTGHRLEGKELEQSLLEKYPFLRREAVVGQMMEGQCPQAEKISLSNGSRAALAVGKGKEIRYELS